MLVRYLDTSIGLFIGYLTALSKSYSRLDTPSVCYTPQPWLWDILLIPHRYIWGYNGLKPLSAYCYVGMNLPSNNFVIREIKPTVFTWQCVMLLEQPVDLA